MAVSPLPFTLHCVFPEAFCNELEAALVQTRFLLQNDTCWCAFCVLPCAFLCSTRLFATYIRLFATDIPRGSGDEFYVENSVRDDFA